MVVLEGEPGIGKTRAVETWCEMHLGEARFVTLSGCVNKSSIFHKIELSLGLSFGQPKKTTQMQSAVESMLKRSGLMLVVDESHFLFSQGNRITSRPEMLDWIDTSCCNEGVPVALIATPQFTECLAHVEKRTLYVEVSLAGLDVHGPLVFDLVDTWSGRSVGGSKAAWLSRGTAARACLPRAARSAGVICAKPASS